MKIYLAGPGVFLPNAKDWGRRLASACAAQGLEGQYPLDQDLPAGLDKAAQRRWIFTQNCALIRASDAIFADLRAFRSDSEPDSGTAFEIGFAAALGKPVWIWLPDCPPGTAQIGRVACVQEERVWIDVDGLIVEDFGAPLNLMLWDAAAGVSYNPEPEAAIADMAQWLRLNQ